MLRNSLTLTFILSFGISGIWFKIDAVEVEKADTLKLAVYLPLAKVYDAPGGDSIGVIAYGRVLNLIASQGSWICFTTREFPSGWIRWENTVTLEQWATVPHFDTLAAYIMAWDKGIHSMEAEIDSSLKRILTIREQIAQGKIETAMGIDLIRQERSNIEGSFRQLHYLYTPEPLVDAAELLESKRWALYQGLGYLIHYINYGTEESGQAAGRYFQLAEDLMYEYSKNVFKVKTYYHIYDNNGGASSP
jgi:hypothetical protein